VKTSTDPRARVQRKNPTQARVISQKSVNLIALIIVVVSYHSTATRKKKMKTATRKKIEKIRRSLRSA